MIAEEKLLLSAAIQYGTLGAERVNALVAAVIASILVTLD